jgi:hypothetical protein
MITSQMMSARALRISYASHLRLYISRHITSFRTPKLNTRSIPTRHSIINPYPTNSPSAHHPYGFARTTQSPRHSPFSQRSSNLPPSLQPSHQITGKHVVSVCYFVTGVSAPRDSGKVTLRHSARRKALFAPGRIEVK